MRGLLLGIYKKEVHKQENRNKIEKGYNVSIGLCHGVGSIMYNMVFCNLFYSSCIFYTSLCFVHPVNSRDKKCFMLMLLVINVPVEFLAEVGTKKFWLRVQLLFE